MNTLKKLEKYLDSYLKTPEVTGRFASKMVMEDSSVCDNSNYLMAESNINNYIDDNKNDDRFQKLLFSYIDDKKLKDSDVYNKVNIDRRLFSKIRNDNYHPSKNTIILLGLSLELSEVEIDKLLDSAAYSLPKNNNRDLIIRFCFKEKIYNPFEVNELLDSYNCQLLF